MRLFIDSNHLSPYAMSVFVALREKSIPFETVRVDLQKGEHHEPTYGAISMTRRVPSIDDDGFHLSESSAICEYLDDKYPATPIYPRDITRKARAREIQAWLRSDFKPLREQRSTEVVFLGRTPPGPLPDDARAAAQRLLDAVDGLLPAGQTSLFGSWSIADTDLALMLNRLVIAGDPVPERVAEYAHAQWQRPSVQEWATGRRAVR
ncbi:MAG: glutathione transferase [Burkholderiaceae bacterium]